jgi:hypothetical protein
LVGWVDIGIGKKGKQRCVASLAKVWKIAKKFLRSIDLYRRGHTFSVMQYIMVHNYFFLEWALWVSKEEAEFYEDFKM